MTSIPASNGATSIVQDAGSASGEIVSSATGYLQKLMAGRKEAVTAGQKQVIVLWDKSLCHQMQNPAFRALNEPSHHKLHWLHPSVSKVSELQSQMG
jgi:hypothetical protein